MRHEVRHMESTPKQHLKSAISLYFPEQNELKTKTSPCIHNFQVTTPHPMQYPSSQCNPPGHAHKNTPTPSLYELEQRYGRLYKAMQRQANSYSEACTRIKQMVLSYYDELVKIVKMQQKTCLSQVEGVLGDGQKRFMGQLRAVYEAARDLHAGHCRKSVQQARADLASLAVLEVPVYRIQSTALKQFERIIKQFKPVFTSSSLSSSALNRSQERQKQKQRQKQRQKQKQQQNTIKKQPPQPYYPAKEPQKDCYDFSCEQEFEWNPSQIISSRKFERKEAVSQIIMEEPSSCQDSLMLSQAA